MKRCESISTAFAGGRRFIWKGALAMIPLIFFGCATVPRPVTIKHEISPPRSDAAATDEQYRKGPADKGLTALVDLLKSKNMISADEAAGFTEPSARAGEKGVPAAQDGVAALLDLLKSKNMISDDEAARFKEQYGVNAAGGKGVSIASEVNDKEHAEKTAAGVSDELKKSIQEQVRSEIQQELPEEIKKAELASAAPEWTKRFSFGGDIRLRYENDRFDKNNALFVQPSNPTQLMNTTINQDRYKYRVHLWTDAKVNEKIDAVISLSTGNTGTPVSTNSILGTFMNKDNVLFDLAYLRWQPWNFITVYGGRMPNPWFSTDLVWSRDLNFEGLAMNLRKPITDSWTSFLTVGAFPLQQNDFSTTGKWLAAGQLGLERVSRNGIGGEIGVAYYDFSNITGVRNSPLNPHATDWTAPLFQQKGNTLFNISADPAVVTTALASEFKELNVTAILDIGLWDPRHIVLLADFVKNYGFDRRAVAERTGNPNQPKETVGYQFGMSVGNPVIQEAGQWRAYLYYKRLEADAVVDAFTDSDFHLGGTNAKGWILGTDVGLLKNAWLTLRWLSANQISGPPLAIDVLQVDLNARF